MYALFLGGLLGVIALGALGLYLIRPRPRHEDVHVGWAVQCCGEHLYSPEEQRIHDETEHHKD